MINKNILHLNSKLDVSKMINSFKSKWKKTSIEGIGIKLWMMMMMICD